MKPLRTILLALMACAVLTCCTEELTNENGNGGNNNGNGGTTTPTQYMWPKYKGLYVFYSDLHQDMTYDTNYHNIILDTRTTIDTNQYGAWFNVYMRGRFGDTLIRVEPEPLGMQFDKVVPFNYRYNIKCSIYIGDTTNAYTRYHYSTLLIVGDSAIIVSPDDIILFRGVKCD